MTLLVGNNLVVSMHYTLTDNEKNVIDSSEGEEPLTYLHGAGNIIPGLEKALIGKVEGDSLQVTIQPEEGYGVVAEDLVQTVDKSVFQGIDEIEPGMGFESETPDGTVHHVVVKKVEGDEVTIDANHPLAGVILNFDVEIVNIRVPSEEEISHGHAH